MGRLTRYITLFERSRRNVRVSKNRRFPYEIQWFLSAIPRRSWTNILINSIVYRTTFPFPIFPRGFYLFSTTLAIGFSNPTIVFFAPQTRIVDVAINSSPHGSPQHISLLISPQAPLLLSRRSAEMTGYESPLWGSSSCLYPITYACIPIRASNVDHSYTLSLSISFAPFPPGTPEKTSEIRRMRGRKRRLNTHRILSDAPMEELVPIDSDAEGPSISVSFRSSSFGTIILS